MHGQPKNRCSSRVCECECLLIGGRARTHLWDAGHSAKRNFSSWVVFLLFFSFFRFLIYIISYHSNCDSAYPFMPSVDAATHTHSRSYARRIDNWQFSNSYFTTISVSDQEKWKTRRWPLIASFRLRRMRYLLLRSWQTLDMMKLYPHRVQRPSAANASCVRGEPSSSDQIGRHSKRFDLIAFVMFVHFRSHIFTHADDHESNARPFAKRRYAMFRLPIQFNWFADARTKRNRTNGMADLQKQK